MDRERAETYLRLLAEDGLRHAMQAPADRRWRWSARLEPAVRALCALGAVGVEVGNSVLADAGLAVAERRGFPAPDLIPARGGPPRQASCRVVPVGQVISVGDDDARCELSLVAYAQSAAGARFMGTGEKFASFPATDDRGVRYHISWMIGPAAMEMLLRPDPRHQIRWLDLTPAGQPAVRVHLDPQVPAPDVTVTRDAHRPGELMLDAIAARILLAVGPSRLAADIELRAFVGASPGYITAALDGAGLLPPDSPLPGQLAELFTRIGLDGHGITTPPGGNLPERWHSLLTRREQADPPAPGILAATVAELPELDGARITIAGLHQARGRTIMHLLVSGVTLDHEWTYDRGTRPMLMVWVRDSNGGWHATRVASVSEWGNAIRMCLEIIPPPDRGTAWIEVLVVGPSAQARAILPLSPRPSLMTPAEPGS
ncbi:MAG: hypothetical protein ACRDOB_13255 [Streptosporangiaceae bacterium]